MTRFSSTIDELVVVGQDVVRVRFEIHAASASKDAAASVHREAVAEVARRACESRHVSPVFEVSGEGGGSHV